MKILFSFGCLAMMGLTFAGTSVVAETINWRNNCSPWEHIPASEAFGNPETALLFCATEEDKTWLALQVHCDAATPTMVVRYRPGFEFTPPVIAQDTENGTEGDDQLSAEDREAAALVAAIPYNDSGIRTQLSSNGGPTEMVFMDFQSFGYTNVANFDDRVGEWAFVEKQPLSPVFSRLITGNYADIKLLAYDKTERFPLRGSSKALRPVIEVCRLAKRAADKLAKN
ncbi:MAG: hypothetical protein QNK92_07265 [Amylibacter sp.]